MPVPWPRLAGQQPELPAGQRGTGSGRAPGGVGLGGRWPASLVLAAMAGVGHWREGL